MTILDIKNLSYSVKSEKKTLIYILNDINIKIKKGEIIGIAGESGSGKTTLIKIIAGLIPHETGDLKFSYEKKNSVQLLFQNHGEIINPLRNIGSMLDDVIKRNKVEEIDVERERIFNLVNLTAKLRNRKCFELSGGEQQRAALARVLAAKPEILLLDEPFSAQDPESQNNMIDIFKRINKETGMTMICISHNVMNLKELCERIYIMYGGKIIEEGSPEDIIAEPRQQYSQFLIRSELYELKREEFDVKN